MESYREHLGGVLRDLQATRRATLAAKKLAGNPNVLDDDFSESYAATEVFCAYTWDILT